MKVKWRQVKRIKKKNDRQFLWHYLKRTFHRAFEPAYSIFKKEWEKVPVDVRFDDYTPPDPTKSYPCKVKVVEVKKGEAPRY